MTKETHNLVRMLKHEKNPFMRMIIKEKLYGYWDKIGYYKQLLKIF
jgi:hypothetical protein